MKRIDYLGYEILICSFNVNVKSDGLVMDSI